LRFFGHRIEITGCFAEEIVLMLPVARYPGTFLAEKKLALCCRMREVAEACRSARLADGPQFDLDRFKTAGQCRRKGVMNERLKSRW